MTKPVKPIGNPVSWTLDAVAGSSRYVEPHRLVSLGRRWYLVAWDLDRGDWRSFRIDRLTAHVAQAQLIVLWGNNVTVSHLHLSAGRVCDPPWNPSAARFLRLCDCPVVPMHFGGQQQRDIPNARAAAPSPAHGDAVS